PTASWCWRPAASPPSAPTPSYWRPAPPTSACTRPATSGAAPSGTLMSLFSLSPYRLALAGLVAASAVLFFWRLADRDLWSSHEARAGMDAQTILADGNWGLPRLFDGRAELQKPPLYYWLVAGVAWLRSGTVDAWAVRLPSAVAALLTVLVLALAVGYG